jgi:hypothetical protein
MLDDRCEGNRVRGLIVHGLRRAATFGCTASGEYGNHPDEN